MTKITFSFILFATLFTTSYSQECGINPRLLEKVKFNHFLYISNKELHGLGINTYFGSETFNLYKKQCTLHISKCNRLNKIIPDQQIVLYELVNNQGIYDCSNGNSIIYNEYYNRKFLVGIDTIADAILYISGSFYQTPIAHFFKLEVLEPNTFIEFLKYKFHVYDMENFKYIKTTENEIIFSADLPLYQTSNILFINIKDFDDIRREHVK